MSSWLFSMPTASGRSFSQTTGSATGVETMIEWLHAHIATLIGVLAAIVAAGSAVISGNETLKQRRLQQQNLRHGIDAQSLSWGNASIDALARAEMFARTRQHQSNDQSFFQQRVNMLLTLSSLLERGRLLFPTADQSDLRPPILEAVHFAHCEIEALTRQGGPTADNSANFIEACRRLVITELHAHLDPRRLQTLVGRYGEQGSAGPGDVTVRINGLKAMLKSRRPGINLGERKETVQ